MSTIINNFYDDNLKKVNKNRELFISSLQVIDSRYDK